MIRENNLNAVAPVAAALSAQEVGLAARANTPLAQLMALSFPYDETQMSDDDKSTLLKATALMTDEGQAGHSVVVDAEVQRVGEAITKHVQFARNVVLPIVGKIYSEVREEVEESGPVPFTVDQVWLHDAVTSPLIQDYIDRYQSTPVLVAPYVGDFPERSEEELVELIQTGSANYDSVLADLLSRINIVQIYNCYYRGMGDVNVETIDGVRSVRFSVLPMAANVNLVVHLLSRALMETPHANSNKSLMEYRTDCAGYIKASAYALRQTLLNWDRYLASNQLILKQVDTRPSAEKTIYVYGPVYQKFLEKDGTAEAIIGANVSGRRQLKYLNEFVELLPQLKLAYSNWLAREDNMRLANSGTIIKEEAFSELKDAINDLSDSDNVCGLSKETMHATANQLVTAIKESDWIKEPYQCIRAVVCKTMFPTSNALRILTLIDEVTEKHEIQDVRVAAYHAIMRLLVEHFLSQAVKVG